MMQERIRTNLKRSIRKFASEANASYGKMLFVLKVDFNPSPLKKSKAQVQSQIVRVKGLRQAELLLEKHKDGRQPPVLWTGD